MWSRSTVTRQVVAFVGGLLNLPDATERQDLNDLTPRQAGIAGRSEYIADGYDDGGVPRRLLDGQSSRILPSCLARVRVNDSADMSVPVVRLTVSFLGFGPLSGSGRRPSFVPGSPG